MLSASHNILMKIELKELKDCGRELKIEVEKEKVEKEFSALYSHLEKTARIPGFRPGKAPLSIIKTHFREEAREEVLGKLIPATLKEALEEKNLASIIEPAVSEIDLQEDNLKYTAYLEVMPEVKLGAYTGLIIRKEKRKIEEKEVEETLAKTKKSLLVEETSIERERQKKEVRKNLELKLVWEEMREEEEQLLSQLEKDSQLQVPATLVQRRLSEIASAHFSRLELTGKNNEEKEQIAKDLIEKLKPQAYRDIKTLFILKEIAEKEKIEATEEEVSERIKQITRLRREAKIEREPENNGEIKEQLKQEKVFEFIKKRARIIWKPEKKIVLS
ncbi:MAG: hypothetical protein COZ37_02355 [bacterium (Candidatus Ratteibacteria) CG_4_10_14_3_um_filter_41_18]|uniref:Trigger factor n=1 Tax=bacterium (Candidatus Ratteibacteria) CG_4_10_14_3_um_filter_41_18 TaxID=2014287 RepID=A0A2M7M470_9BACT|nr:MAG: hypothetical protein COZ37_02355 [bacterium (Candidatus Ratteibacteria) CG_4_10_14_3_um_filter_41_18]